MGLLACLAIGGCGDDNYGPPVAGGDYESEASWMRELRPIPEGEVVASTRFPHFSGKQWAVMGFSPLGNGAWRREVRTDATVHLIATDVPELPSIDCIAIISVYRDTGDEPYVYRTLRSMFRNLPAGIQVNVLVGDDHTDYLAPARLAEVLGPVHAQQVHVHGTCPRVAAFLRETYQQPRQRATWNAARVLRSYKGTRGLLALEDDIVWTAEGLAPLERVMNGNVPPLITLFNKPCAKLSRAPAQMPAAPEIVRPDLAQHQFLYTQGLWYSPEMARWGGDYLHQFMHGTHYDIMLDTLLRRRGLEVGYLYPGIIQHIGLHTAVESDAVPTSACLVADPVG